MDIKATEIEADGEKFKTVTYRKPRKTVFGKKTDVGLLKAVEARSSVFVSRLDPATSETDVKQYLEDNGVSVAECTKLDIRSVNIAAFKLTVNRGQEDVLFSENMWPVNTIIRRYRKPNFQRSGVEDKKS